MTDNVVCFDIFGNVCPINYEYLKFSYFSKYKRLERNIVNSLFLNLNISVFIAHLIERQIITPKLYLLYTYVSRLA